MEAGIGWSEVLISVVAATIGFLFSYILQQVGAKTNLKGKFIYRTYDQDLTKMVEFLERRGTKELIDFFENTPLEEIKMHLLAIKNFSSQFADQSEYLERIERLITSTLFNSVTGRIHQHIESNTLFTKRLKVLENTKKYLRDHILDVQEIFEILQKEDSIFIKSGSTLAYCMLQIIDNIKELRTDIDTNETRHLRVCTNNIGIYILLLFEKYFDPILLPGKPDNQYGATFADINEYEPGDANRVLEFLSENKVTALFTTASNLDIEYGPHVSSPENYAMKRILNEYANKHNYPNIMVISAGKINKNVSECKLDEHCILIFDGKHTANICEDVAENKIILEEVKKAWDDHLRKGNNYIITGSDDKNSCYSILKELSSTKYFMDVFPLDLDGGHLAKFRYIKH